MYYQPIEINLDFRKDPSNPTFSFTVSSWNDHIMWDSVEGRGCPI